MPPFPELKLPPRPEAFVLNPATTEQHSENKLETSFANHQFTKNQNEFKVEQQLPKIEQLSTPDLLEVAAHIKIDGASVRKLFENNQIDRHGLEAIVKESLKGGDIKRVFKKHVLGFEARQGRAIEMRHDNPATIPSVAILSEPNQNVQAVIDQLKHNPVDTEKKPNLIAPADSAALLKSEKDRKAATHKSNPILITISAAIAVAIGSALAIFFG